MRWRWTNLETLSSFDPVITTIIMQSDDVSMSASVNRNGHRGAVFGFPSSNREMLSMRGVVRYRVGEH